MGIASLKFEVVLRDHSCGKCGGVYAINEAYWDKCAEDGSGWSCPYCQTSWSYGGNSENARLKRELEAERQRKQNALNDANALRLERDKATRALSRHKTRAKNGTCPCCNRTFSQLARHMANKHPEYAK